MPTNTARAPDDNRVRRATPLPAAAQPEWKPLPRKRPVASPAPTGHVYGYARVSTVAQADEGESLEVQQRTIAGYAQMHGLKIDNVFVERGVSGSKPPLGDRPQGMALLGVLRPGDVVIAGPDVPLCPRRPRRLGPAQGPQRQSAHDRPRR